MKNQSKVKDQSGSSNLSLIGGFIALFCFFAPWAGCGRQVSSGMDIASDEPEYYAILASAIVIIISFMIFKSINKLSKSKLLIGFTSLFSLGFLLIKLFEYLSDDTSDYIKLKWGVFATFLGFLLSLIGVSYFRDKRAKQQPDQIE